MELFGFLEISLLDFTFSGRFLEAKQGVEVDPGRLEVFLLRLSQ